MLIKNIVPIFSLIFLLCSPCFANELLFIDINSRKSIENKYLEVASNYYGIEVVHCYSKNKCFEQINGSLKTKTIGAIIMTANSLSSISYSYFFNILNKNEKKIPTMIIGISPDNEAEVKLWSNGSIKNVKSISSLPYKSYYSFSGDSLITRQLAGLYLHNKNKLANYFVMENKDNYKSIINLYFKKDKYLLPIFFKKMDFGGDVFFLTKIVNDNLIDNGENKIGKDRFYEIAPFMMFLKYACKNRCWHSNSYYANLTIDDPWLHEPYGNLSYINLLKEMKKDNFHTTIGFIAWNYNRSDNNVVSLVRNNLNKYSIVIHGNNHNHEEFYPLDNYGGNGNPKLLDLYEMKIAQAVARMGKFTELTQIPYDPVMIFPHKIAPRYAISLLKKKGFLATVNSSNVPWGSEEPKDPTHLLRCITMDFDGFASYRRQWVNNIKKEDIAIELFLDNPIFLYTHQDYFAGNIGKFNPIAKVVNKLQPDVIWGSLGYIIRNYYLKKLRKDGNYEILMYTNELTLKNNSNAPMKYFIKKKELPLYDKILHVYIDGRPISYRYNNKYIAFEVMIPKQKSKEIAIRYRNEMALVENDFAKNNYYYAALRYISDFRDIVLSKNKYSRKIIDIYYNPESFKMVIVMVIGIFGFFIVALISIKKRNIIFRDINK